MSDLLKNLNAKGLVNIPLDQWEALKAEMNANYCEICDGRFAIAHGVHVDMSSWDFKVRPPLHLLMVEENRYASELNDRPEEGHLVRVFVSENINLIAAQFVSEIMPNLLVGLE